MSHTLLNESCSKWCVLHWLLIESLYQKHVNASFQQKFESVVLKERD